MVILTSVVVWLGLFAHGSLAAGSLSLSERIANIAESIDTNLDYLIQAPIKAGELVEFAAGALAHAPLTTPILSPNPAGAGFKSTTQQLIWAVYEITGLDSYVAYDSSGVFLYVAYDPEKLKPAYGYRSADPAICNATTSSLPSDTKYTPITNCRQDFYVDSQGNPTNSFENNAYDPRTTTWYTTAKSTGTDAWSPLFITYFGTPAISYSLPIYSSSKKLVSVIGFDYELSSLEGILQLLNTDDTVSYIMETDSRKLIANSVGEPITHTSTNPAAPSFKQANEANNAQIKLSAAYIVAHGISAPGEYSFNGLDKWKYTFQLMNFVDPTKTLKWTIVVVARSNTMLESNFADATQLINVIAADLTAGTSSLPADQHETKLQYFLVFFFPSYFSDQGRHVPRGFTSILYWTRS